jgi:Na+/H+-dicarboxylate symporter
MRWWHKESLMTDFIVGVFMGGALSSIAQDPSDTLFFYAAAQGWLSNPTNQTIFWYIIPFLVYGVFALAAYILGRTTNVSPLVVLWIYLASVLFSAFYSLTLPQVSSYIYDEVVVGATVISVVLIYGIYKQAKRFPH